MLNVAFHKRNIDKLKYVVHHNLKTGDPRRNSLLFANVANTATNFV